MNSKASHPSDDQLELFALRRLSRTEAESIDNHLLICDPCRTRCEETADFAQAMRDALRVAPAEAESRWFAWLRPNFAMAGVFAALVLAVGIYWVTGNARLAPLATLQLTAVRGAEIRTVSRARELDIRLADAAGASRVEVVGADGAAVWSGGYAPKIAIEKSLRPGEYLVRAYLPSGQMLHEYEFQVK